MKLNERITAWRNRLERQWETNLTERSLRVSGPCPPGPMLIGFHADCDQTATLCDEVVTHLRALVSKSLPVFSGED